MYKKPSPPFWFKFAKKTAIACFVIEGATFAGAYAFWYRLNTRRGLLENK
jgi:hypothetical protein